MIRIRFNLGFRRLGVQGLGDKKARRVLNEWLE